MARRDGAVRGRLDGRAVVLTGAAAGIGRVYARRLAREGARLSLVDLDAAGARAAAAECRGLGATAVDVVADVSEPAAARSAIDESAARLGGIDALVNNAALFSTLPNRPFEDIPPDEVDRVLAVNVRGPFLLCQAAVPHLRRAGGGKIVNVGSGIVLSATPGMAHYVASKGAVFALTRALAREAGAGRNHRQHHRARLHADRGAAGQGRSSRGSDPPRPAAGTGRGPRGRRGDSGLPAVRRQRLRDRPDGGRERRCPVLVIVLGRWLP